MAAINIPGCYPALFSPVEGVVIIPIDKFIFRENFVKQIPAYCSMLHSAFLVNWHLEPCYSTYPPLNHVTFQCIELFMLPIRYMDKRYTIGNLDKFGKSTCTKNKELKSIRS